ncbi:hypothetical protein OPV22_026577 [Ensete ventricosum]|uniref:Uncharacterized protein n=1 Tax=Ensete ventricosum TaxID=4639 RepID=A0AAV8QLZ0_ENSVE|nr:hypothetical protein OPV22_026577 [Ensete ventricosum]
MGRNTRKDGFCGVGRMKNSVAGIEAEGKRELWGEIKIWSQVRIQNPDLGSVQFGSTEPIYWVRSNRFIKPVSTTLPPRHQKRQKRRPSATPGTLDQRSSPCACKGRRRSASLASQDLL